ncbi:hypothetical protein M514_24486 [Trichuris suis]|uniref:GIY-YIG domain-containing protein n=1 Tax=Trichuris suis TaxID=68888 RepID=A0A085N1G0_9BILA|nr:hypothetical protein M514_24486 [Trichuris suis]
MELESSNTLPFLDVLIIRKGGQGRATVYRKPTNSGLYLRCSSNRHRPTLLGVANGMVDRAVNVSDEKRLNDELRDFERTLRHNDDRVLLSRYQESGCSLPTLALPYCEGLGEKIKKFQRVFQLVRQRVVDPRNDKLETPDRLSQDCVYKLICDCSAVYIGETSSSLLDRFEQHLRDIAR